ncbi:hypothetical protein LO763_18835 [Glycomyces sp. A-F 0318]|uniref:WXG100 family type VII secretion target n=1 Tax=Glycomyces amatae TaxID=2881355 RepID=UPI001E351DF2|nr:hypothetical protein [Glycomyces amatae]MCD0445666.1 hypothetical protein [Glycomyces amatae]
MADLDLDLESFRRAADEFDAAKEEVQALLDQFTGTLAQFADAFGGDEIGMLVGMAHDACTEVLNECFTTNIEEIADYAEAIRDMADGHEAADNENAQLFNQLLTELGG